GQPTLGLPVPNPLLQGPGALRPRRPSPGHRPGRRPRGRLLLPLVGARLASPIVRDAPGRGRRTRRPYDCPMSLERALALAREQRPQAEQDLFEELRIPSVSTLPSHRDDVRRNCDWL